MSASKKMAPAVLLNTPRPGPRRSIFMATTKDSASAHPSTRELRGIALYQEHRDEIRYEDGLWYVPSQNDVTSVYEVVIGRRGESCECRDFEHRGGRCLHIYAATIAKAKTAPCSGCGKRYRHRHLTEVSEDHLSLFEGDLLCPECCLAHGVA
jgi:SWIM zinc finger